ncbi:MAG: GTP-binding protein [Lentisphaerae bacterium]|nr:GTP-binding protein [Lentisphaerota bacterium]
MIPLCLVAGFLGSGKTTLLRRIATANRGRRLLFLVNEFSSSDIDGRTLAAEGLDVIALPGGSIFCRCLVTQFIGQLDAIAARAAAGPLDGVVIEASGMADPRVIVRLLVETRLDARYALARVIAVADPVRLLKLVRTLPAIRAQLEAADVVVLNKCDLAPPAVCDEAEALARGVRPGAEVLRAVRAEVEVDPFPPAPGREPAGEYAACRDPAFETFRIGCPGGVDVARLAAAVAAAGDDLHRLKGFVRSGGRVVSVQAAGGAPEIVRAPDVAGALELVCIVRGGTADRVRPLLEASVDASA